MIEQEAVGHIYRGTTIVISHDLPRVVYRLGRAPNGPVNTHMHRAGYVKRGVPAVIEQEAVCAAASRDLARGVYPVGIGAEVVGRAWHVERGETVSWLGLSLSRHPKKQV